MFAGGEFYYDGEWLLDQPLPAVENRYFLNGGRACLAVIGDYLIKHGVRKILLPSYLCPSILDALERCGLRYRFYQVNEDLSIDLDDLAQKTAACQAVYFINYFGFTPRSAARDQLKSLREKGMLVIEDNAQAGFSANPIGDFVFNSLRKLVPFDGGYLDTDLDIAPYLLKYQARPNRRLPLIRDYRRRLHDYLLDGIGSHKELVDLYAQADRYYDSDVVVEGDPGELAQIGRLDWAGIRKRRRENYIYLLGLIAHIREVKPIFPALQPDMMPMGLPVYLSGVSRDAIYEHLGENGIGLFIHWEELRHDTRTNANALTASMAGRMLTLAIDQRTSRAQLDYLEENLASGVQKVKRNR